jgi:hypothetical protein
MPTSHWPVRARAAYSRAVWRSYDSCALALAGLSVACCFIPSASKSFEGPFGPKGPTLSRYWQIHRFSRPQAKVSEI